MKRFKTVPKIIIPKPKVCVACNGSGYYDNNGSPKCSLCDGTGFRKVYFLCELCHQFVEFPCEDTDSCSNYHHPY